MWPAHSASLSWFKAPRFCLRKFVYFAFARGSICVIRFCLRKVRNCSWSQNHCCYRLPVTSQHYLCNKSKWKRKETCLEHSYILDLLRLINSCFRTSIDACFPYLGYGAIGPETLARCALDIFIICIFQVGSAYYEIAWVRLANLPGAQRKLSRFLCSVAQDIFVNVNDSRVSARSRTLSSLLQKCVA